MALITSAGSAEDPALPSAMDDLQKDREVASKTGEYDVLHKATAELTVEHKELSLQDTSPASSSSSEEGVDNSDDLDAFTFDDEPATDVKDDDNAEDKEVEDEQKKSADGKRTTDVTETLRNEHFDRYALEAIDWQAAKEVANDVGSGLYSAASFTGRQLLAFMGIAKDLGIQYGPDVLKFISLATLTLFTKSVKVVLKALFVTSSFIRRTWQSNGKSRKKIEQLKSQLGQLTQHGQLMLKMPSTKDEKLISWMTAGSKTSAETSATVMMGMMEQLILPFEKNMLQDIGIVKRLIDLAEGSNTGDPIAMLRVSPIPPCFSRKFVQGYAQDPEHMECFTYNTPLPDNVIMIMNLPKQNLMTMEDISHAYGQAGVFLGVSPNPSMSASELNYMDAKGLSRYLDSLATICDLVDTHSAAYRRIGKEAAGLKFNYKHYYQKLISTGHETTTRETLAEYVYLKQSFASKTWLPAMMDIHDFVGVYLVKAIRFAQSNIAQLKAVETN